MIKNIKISNSSLDTLLLRAQREGRGDAKREILELLEEARLEPKEKVTLTYLRDKIRSQI
mgnify:CR=1 FL=1